MAFSARTTELMLELDRTVAELEANANAIATELAKGADGDTTTLLRSTRTIEMKVWAHRSFTQKVKEGPDAPTAPDFRPRSPLAADWPTLERRSRDIALGIAQWPQVQHQITRLINFDREALYPDLPDGFNALHHQQVAADDIWKILHAVLNPNAQDADAKEAGGFADIPLRQSDFFAHVQAASRVCVAQRRDRPVRFLDVGCGGGLKVLSAARFFDRSDGLDFDPGYVTAAQDLLRAAQQDDSVIQTADALTFDGYGDYDVIYFYRPLKDEAKLRQLEDRIAAHAKPKALLIAPYVAFARRCETLNCANVAGQLYLTQSTDEEAAALRAEAEVIAPHPPPKAFTFAPLWEPIGTALRARTFH